MKYVATRSWLDLFTEYYSDNQLKKDEMDMAYSVHWVSVKCINIFIANNASYTQARVEEKY